MNAPRAHPRSRGENYLSHMQPNGSLGSSPLTRGKRMLSVVVMVFIGLIPAHAGKTDAFRTPANHCKAHPRSRGENNIAHDAVHFAAGSSPLTRGKRFSRTASRNIAGLIPAHAGKTGVSAGALEGGQAHPRSRGENPTLILTIKRGRGSSPLTRGKLCVGTGR